MAKVPSEFSEESTPGTRRLEAEDATAGARSPRRRPSVRRGQEGKQKEMA